MRKEEMGRRCLQKRRKGDRNKQRRIVGYLEHERRRGKWRKKVSKGKERKKKYVLEADQRNERILKQVDVWREGGNHRKRRGVK